MKLRSPLLRGNGPARVRQTRGRVVFKFIAVIVCLSLLAFAAWVFEAASVTQSALSDINGAAAAHDGEIRLHLLGRAQTTLLTSWARPTAWHAGATEALSAAYFIESELTGEVRLLDESARWAQATVRLSPISPHAWTRLAALAERGHGAEICTLARCLEKSWASARMIDPETGCLRLQIAHRHNLLAPADPRIDDYLKSGPSDRSAARCLQFLPASDLFARLLNRRLEQSRAARALLDAQGRGHD